MLVRAARTNLECEIVGEALRVICIVDVARCPGIYCVPRAALVEVVVMLVWWYHRGTTDNNGKESSEAQSSNGFRREAEMKCGVVCKERKYNRHIVWPAVQPEITCIVLCPKARACAAY